MGAKEIKSWHPIAAPIHPDWNARIELLTIFQLMTITQMSYYQLLEDVRAGVLKPARPRKPYRFTPGEILRVYFSEGSGAKEQTKVHNTRAEVRRRVTKRKKGDLCLD